MNKTRRGQKIGFLAGLILVGIAFSLLLHFHVRLTGTHQIDGILGVLLGLYTCAQPAANVLDIVLYGRYLPAHEQSERSRIYWWGLNILVLFVGWIVIVTSLLRYSAQR